MHFAQRLTHGAVIGLIAGTVFGKTMGQDHRTINCPDHFERRNRAGMPHQFIAAIRAGNGLHNTRARQLLEHLSQKRDRQMIGFGHLLSAGGSARHRGQMPQGNQAVIRFFGQLQHESGLF